MKVQMNTFTAVCVDDCYVYDLKSVFLSCICCSVEIIWDYFIHVCHGPFSFSIFDFGYKLLLVFPIFLYAYDSTSHFSYMCIVCYCYFCFA